MTKARNGARQQKTAPHVVESFRVADVPLRTRLAEDFRQIVESAPNAVVVISRDGRIEMMNAEAERAFGYARAELLGQQSEFLVPTRYRADHVARRMAFFARPKMRPIGAVHDVVGLRKDGSEFPVEVGLNPIETEAGTMMLAGIIDVSARKQMQHLLAAVVESSADAISATNLNGIITSWNAAAERMFGYTADEAIGAHIRMFSAPGYENEMADIAKRVRAGETFDAYDTMRRRKDGSIVPVSLSLSPIRDQSGAIIGVSTVAHDITEHVKAQERILLQAAELQRSNAELTQFAYVASHDLKAPLRAIQNLAEWIAEDLPNDASDETRENLALLRRRGERLQDLLSGLLEYSRVGRIKEAPQRVDAEHLIAEIMEYLVPPAGFTIAWRGPMLVQRVSKAPLELVLRNLIDNALKHHDRDTGTVLISARDLGEVVEFTVQDDGPGIDPAYHDRIFVVFQTLKPRDDVEGSGVGLAIVKKTVEAHGGHISVESEPPQRGASFIFTWRKAEE
jgi:PAS domain S-box-containing protein